MNKLVCFAIALGGVVGCGDDSDVPPFPDAKVVNADAMGIADAATVDSATTDAASVDAAVPDAMTAVDSALSVADSAAPLPDAAVPDGALPTPDAALPDAMTPDAMTGGGTCMLSSAMSFTNSSTMAIADAGTTASTINVSGVGTILYSVRVSTGISHAASSDLIVTAISPGGTRIILTSRNGGLASNNLFNGTVWSDTATTPVTDATFTSTLLPSLIPESALSPLRGEDPNGTWTLEIVDASLGVAGTLLNWAVEVTTVNSTPVESTTMASSSNTRPISMSSPATDSIVVSGFSGTICDVDVTTNVTHTYGGDLTLTLISPAGTRVTLSSDNGSDVDNTYNGTLFDDDALDPASLFMYVDGVTATPLTPEGALGQLEGEAGNGTWQLEVTDSFADDDGTLSGWTLAISSCSCTI